MIKKEEPQIGTDKQSVFLSPVQTPCSQTPPLQHRLKPAAVRKGTCIVSLLPLSKGGKSLDPRQRHRRKEERESIAWASLPNPMESYYGSTIGKKRQICPLLPQSIYPAGQKRVSSPQVTLQAPGTFQETKQSNKEWEISLYFSLEIALYFRLQLTHPYLRSSNPLAV